MEKVLKIILIIIIIILIATIFFTIGYYISKIREGYKKEYVIFKNDNITETKKAIVVKVNEKSLDVMDLENSRELYSVSFTSEGNIGFKQGQEILVYFDGTILMSFPGQITNVEKIEIIKEQIDTIIPDDVLRFYYSSINKVTVTINELTRNGLTFTITDKNELPYEYSNSYTIYKKVKNENYTENGYKIGEDTINATSGFTRNRY